MPSRSLRNFLLILSLGVGSPGFCDDAIDVGGRKQLFIDRRFIAESEGITLQTNPAQKLGSVVDLAGNPLPMAHIGRVVDVDGSIRMYVGADAQMKVLESQDGLRFRDSGRTIATKGFLPTVFYDPHDPDPHRRYKLFSTFHREPFDRDQHGVYAAYSGDGFEFTDAGRVLPFLMDNPCVVHWDNDLGKYVVFTRAFCYDSQNQRRIARIETDDPLKPWPYHATGHDRDRLAVDNVDVVLQADKDDYHPSDIYYNASAIYTEAADTYLMFTAQFRHFYPETHPFVPRKAPGEWEDFGFLEIQLAVSRDGRHWDRPTREPYFSMGLADEWDRWHNVMGPGIVRRGNYLFQYYYSTGQLHDSTVLREEYRHAADRQGGLGLVRQRLDGFVSADADYRGGWLETHPIRFTGQRLRLNIDTGGMGHARVEIRDLQGRPIPGFAREDCEEIGGNFVDQSVYFRGRADVSALAGQPVKLYFQLVRAKLFAFQFTPQ